MTVNDIEPKPVKTNNPAVWDLVFDDMRERDMLGIKRYETRLQPFNGRSALRDLYQELLDSVAYIRQLIWEEENKIEEKNETNGKSLLEKRIRTFSNNNPRE